ncbi:hypothetical protein BD408DRAFT_423308 [Parasitella parasitica]|nr:hypothetical protein BD408DRAFT_423308 [Parasitella parasitica]
MSEIMSRNQAVCLVYLLPFSIANVMLAKRALQESRLEVCYKDDPQLPFLLPLTTYNRALKADKIHTFPDK